MDPLDDKVTFTRPRFLSTGFHSQVILCNTRLSGKSVDKPITCVLKFFPGRFELFFEKELQAYRRLLDSKTTLKYPKPLGFAEWPTAKYIKTIGRSIEPLEGADTESAIFVLLLEYVETRDVSSNSVTIEVAVAALESLNMLHQEGIVHGDISIGNTLAFENDVGETDVMWIDFSCSWTDASPKQIEWEWQRAVEYFAKLADVKVTDLLAETSELSTAPQLPPPNLTKHEAVPRIPDDMKFDHLTFMSKGTHALVFRGKEAHVEDSQFYCIKLFRKGWATPFNLELTAYERLLHDRKIQKYIPHVYGYSLRTLSEWGFDRSSDDKDVYSGIVLEWIENAEPLSRDNVTIHNAGVLLAGMSKIHESGVLHYDAYMRNTLVVPETRRAVWIDFSCAHMNEEAYHGGEMESAASTILYRLFEKARRQGFGEAISAYATYTPLSRRIWALSYSFTLALEGLGWLFGRSILFRSSSTRISSPIDYGPLNLFTSALLATDSCAIHLHSPLFHLAWVIKLLYPLFSASVSSTLLISKSVFGFHRLWIAIRLLFTVLWICSCLGEVKWWETRPLPDIPGVEFEDSSEDASSESVASDDSRDIFDRQPFVPYDERE